MVKLVMAGFSRLPLLPDGSLKAPVVFNALYLAAGEVVDFTGLVVDGKQPGSVVDGRQGLLKGSNDKTVNGVCPDLEKPRFQAYDNDVQAR
ncbi:unnamed protein product [marine sediment metagenome]|uniref:Uncharacterized protein n=1 Tax=marine sediment metagenome TaxID=412755 RepID=X1SNK0_9ZZZZ